MLAFGGNNETIQQQLQILTQHTQVIQNQDDEDIYNSAPMKTSKTQSSQLVNSGKKAAVLHYCNAFNFILLPENSWFQVNNNL